MLGFASEPTYLPAKAKRTGPGFEATLEAVVDAAGPGRVRSLIVTGLEPLAHTLRGIAWLAERGCDPVLSPFRPAPGTRLDTRPPPSDEELAQLLIEARAIVADSGVVLGPRCIPCQHNTLSFPSDVYSGPETKLCGAPNR